MRIVPGNFYLRLNQIYSYKFEPSKEFGSANYVTPPGRAAWHRDETNVEVLIDQDRYPTPSDFLDKYKDRDRAWVTIPALDLEAGIEEIPSVVYIIPNSRLFLVHPNITIRLSHLGAIRGGDIDDSLPFDKGDWETCRYCVPAVIGEAMVDRTYYVPNQVEPNYSHVIQRTLGYASKDTGDLRRWLRRDQITVKD